MEPIFLNAIEPIDYLAIGHITLDLTPEGPRLGGTAAYAALTARAFGLRAGIVTSFCPSLALTALQDIPIVLLPAAETTTFENKLTPDGRVQVLHSRAEGIDPFCIPETWRSTPLVHLAPVAQEVDISLARLFPESFIGMTPQGWFRRWDSDGHVSFAEWPEASYALEQASAAVLSTEDVGGDERIIDEMLSSVRLMAVTEGAAGARVYWQGEMRSFLPPQVEEIDPTGAGDVFAAAFFINFHLTHDPWEAAQLATALASASVTRRGLAGVPTPDQVVELLSAARVDMSL